MRRDEEVRRTDPLTACLKLRTDASVFRIRRHVERQNIDGRQHGFHPAQQPGRSFLDGTVS